MAYTNIKKSSDYFNTVTYSGSETPQTITGVNFSADMAWFKNRTGTAAAGNIYDTVRGISDGWLYTNETAASDNSGQPQITLNSDGYVLNTGYDIINDGASTYVSWNWKANGAGVANTDGTISSTVSANTTSGFSIVKYTGTGSAGATVGHGLGVKPAMIIFKCLSVGGPSWVVYHQSKGATYTLYLNETSAGGTSAEMLNNTEPTSSLITLGNGTSSNSSGASTIAYCFAEKQGFSKFGSYIGNGSTDGTFVYTGFKPAFVLVKSTDLNQSWQMSDNKRNSFNVVSNRLRPNESTAESTSPSWVDFNSQGFKFRHQDIAWNGSGNSYIYMAFAEEPLVGDNPATAR